MAKQQVCPKHPNGRSCSFLINEGEQDATCYRCGRTIPVGLPIDIGFAHLAADVRGYGLRSRARNS